MRTPGSYTSSVAVNYGGGDQSLSGAGGLGATAAIYVGGAGNLTCRLANSAADVTFTGLVAGQIYRLSVVVIRQTGSTITNAVALYEV